VAATSTERRGLGRRLAWFAGLWLAGVATISLVAWMLRALIVP
jgi:hypothetical protein